MSMNSSDGLTTFTAHYESRRIRIDDIELETACWGTGARDRLPILLLHEGLGSIRLWKDFPEQLARATGRDVIAWSRRGHGWSDKLTAAHGPGYMHGEANLLPQIQAALGVPRAHWLGHSDGGSIALIAAARFPALVASLVLEAPHIFVEDLTVASIAKVAAGFSASDMGERMKRYHADPVSLFEKWSAIWLDPIFRSWNIEDLLARIAAPALLIQGRDDQYGTMRQLDSIEGVIAETRRLELDCCGHSPHFDRKDAVIDAICAFLNEREVNTVSETSE